MKLNAWFLRQRNTRPRTMPTETVSKRRTVLRTTVTLSRDPSVAMKLHRKWTLPTRLPWKARLKKPSVGSTATPQLRRRNTKALPCRSFKRWEVAPEVCPEVCQVVCLTWEELLRVPRLPLTLQEDLLSKKLIKRIKVHALSSH